MALKVLAGFLATLVLGIFSKALLEKASESFAEKLANDAYEGAKTVLDWLWHFAPDGPDWSYSYKCPTWAAKYVREKPHGKYVARREEDIEKLRKLFDSFEYSNGILNVVYLVGVPGSGKTELARQFGNSVFCKRKGAPIVVTLNTESPEGFKLSLAESIWEMEESQQNGKHAEVKDLMEEKVDNLFRRLKRLLKNRPRWLLIVDNVRDPNIAQRDMHQRLPKPGESEWGTGKMLVTTQIPLEYSNSTYIRIQDNTGLTLSDATNFLLKLVNESARCNKFVAKRIVAELELLPLSILAAGDRIKRKISESFYRCEDYLSEYSAELNSLPAHNVTIVTQITGYNSSMLAALHLSITSALEVHSNVFRDFIALIGFATVNRRTISVKYVDEYLAMMGHNSEKREKKLDFPLVYYSKKDQLFRVHQVVSSAFREALKRTNSDEWLQYTLRNMSLFFADQYEFRLKCVIKGHYSDVVENINCFKLETFLYELDYSPTYSNRVPVELKFKGFQALHKCYKTFGKVNGSYLAARKVLRLIKKVVPEHTELHTIPVSWFLLTIIPNIQFNHFRIFNHNSNTSKFRIFNAKQFHHHVTFFLLFPHYLKFPHDGHETRRKLCSSLCKATHILTPGYEEKVRMYCKPDLDNPTVREEMMTLIPCYKGKGSISIEIKPFMSEYYIPLGRNVRLGQHIGIINPYGECVATDTSLPGIVPDRILKFYVNYDKRVGLKIRQITEHKYKAVFLFLKMVDEMQVKMNWKDNSTTSQSIKYRLMVFSNQTELRMKNDVKTIMKSFHEDLLLFVNDYCDSLYTLNVTELHVMFYTWYMNIIEEGDCLFHQNIEVLINELLRAAGLEREETKEITEMLIEIIAATIYVATNDNFQVNLEIIPSGRPSLEVLG